MKHLEGLNPNQAEAVRHVEGPLLVNAGAGSGKTRVLTARICHLVRANGVHPARILAVTFTNKAADEMRSRVVHMLGGRLGGMWISTFHSIGARLLRRHAHLLGGWDADFSVFDAADQVRLTKEISKRLSGTVGVQATVLRGRIGEMKQRLISRHDYGEALDGVQGTDPGSPLDRVAVEALPLYEKALRERNAFDFDDLLLWPLRLFESEPEVLDLYQERFAFVLVDEYQDTNHPQFLLIDNIGRGHGNVMVVGDPDQAIYAWRGADVGNILDFEKSYEGARSITLELNYRSRQSILDVANAVIRANLNRPEKSLRAVREGGSKVTILHASDEKEEAIWIAEQIRDRALDDPEVSYRDFALLYRTNAQSRALEAELLLRGIPYQIVGGVRFYERREIQDVIAYLRVIANPRDASAFARAIGYPKRGVGQMSRERVIAWAEAHEMSIVAACAVAEEIPGIPPRARVALHDFARLITEHHDDPDLELSRRIQVLVDAVGIMNHLRAEGPEGEDRVRNVEELIAAAAAFGTEDDEVEEADPQLSPLALFLQQISLLADVDRLDSGENSVSLMTLHSAKGLEFPIVYLTGAEERLLPLVRPDSDLEQLEEERRLFYVGVTRAEDALTISWALRRRRGGSYQDGVASSFLLNIPRALLTHRRCGWWARRRDQRRMFTGHGDRGPQQSQQFQTAPTRYSPGVGAGRRRDGAATAREMRFPDVEDESQEAPVRLVKGSRVRHQHFGSGMVRGLSGFGLNVRVEVEFDEGGRKTLLVRKAKLESDWP